MLLQEEFGTQFKVGDTIKIIEMNGEPEYTGKTGKIEHIDSTGQLHGTWGSLAVIPSEDEVEIIANESEVNESFKMLKEDIEKFELVGPESDTVIENDKPVADEAVEAQRPDYADAVRNLEKTDAVRQEKIKKDLESAVNHDGPVEGKVISTPEMKKMHLSESLFD